MQTPKTPNMIVQEKTGRLEIPLMVFEIVKTLHSVFIFDNQVCSPAHFYT